MSNLINVLPLTSGPVWGAWEALALALLTSAGAGMCLAALLTLAGRSASVARPLIIMSLTTALVGLVALAMGLEQPQRAWEFLSTPSATSWTAVGAYIVPLFVVCCALAFFRARQRGVPGKPLLLVAALFGLAVLAYASLEIGSCVGRQMWTSPWLPLAFAAAGVTGASGLAFGAGVGADEPANARVLAGVLAVAALVSGLALLALPPSAPLSGGWFWWHLPDILCLLAGGVSLLGWSQPGRFRLLLSGAGIVTVLLAYWKIILMGQSISRLGLTFSGGGALTATLTGSALLALAGCLGLLVAGGILLTSIWPATQAGR
jgi:hypothetical protein